MRTLRTFEEFAVKRKMKLGISRSSEKTFTKLLIDEVKSVEINIGNIIDIGNCDPFQADSHLAKISYL